MPQYVFFLGGYDLEMLAIRNLIFQKVGFFNKRLAWGAKASAYQSEIQTTAIGGYVPVLIELEVDIELPSSAIVIDHHGDRSGEEASIIQVMKLLQLEPTREHLLIAANDSGYIPAMQAMGATQAEIDDIRRRDRQAQGVTKEMEEDAERAIAKMTEGFGGLKVVALSHNKCSPVTDRLFASWPDGKQNLLVMCNCDDLPKYGEYNYFGRGDVCKAFKEKFAPDSWGGGKGYGDSNGSGFAGCRNTSAYAVQLFFNEQFQ